MKKRTYTTRRGMHRSIHNTLRYNRLQKALGKTNVFTRANASFARLWKEWRKKITKILHINSRPAPQKQKNTNLCEKGAKKVRKKAFGWKKWLVRLAQIGAVCCVIGFIAIVGVFAYFAKDLPEPGKVNTRAIDESTKIYDRTGTVLLYDIHGEEKRTIIAHDEIPAVVKNATIALEDHNFYTHIGFDIKGVINAVLSNVLHVGNGRGGSTITQQFVKNSLLTSERSIARKIKELILAVEIEMRFSKDDILGMYLNEIPYGSNAYGIEAAAQTFFNKHAKDLTLDEAALLASLPKAPSRYSPYGSHTDRLKMRQEYALDEMVELGFVEPEVANNAKNVDVFAKLAKNRENIKAPHFVMYVRDQLEETYGNEYLEKEGLRVITTLDWEKQQIAEEVVRERVRENHEKYNAENAALVAIDPQNGDILTMVGSRDYFDTEIDGQVNVAIRDRQPGSSFKPYAYLHGFEKGYTPETILYDVPTNFKGKGSQDYEPQNYDGTFRGPLKVKESLAMSLNIPAVKMLYLAGEKDVIKLAKKLGITSLKDPDRYGLSLVLGGGEVRLLDHTAAFAVFANNGVKHDKRAILAVTDGDEELFVADDDDGKRIVEEQYIAMLSYILSTNKYRAPAFGENNALRFDERPVAAKTGTTNENRDAWTMGYTPDVAIGVWAGNNNNASMNSRGVGANAAAPIFRDFLTKAYPHPSGKKFPKYDKEDHKTGKDILDGKKEDEEKMEVCEIPGEDDKYCKANKYCPHSKRKKRTFIDAHNILYYVKKDDPRGDKPEHPKKDPQYKRWQKGVKDYYKDQTHGRKIILDEQPEECKKEDFEKYDASISLSVPDTVTTNRVTISVDADSEYKINKITYYIEDKEVHESTKEKYEYKIPDKYNNKKIDVKVVVEDRANNTATAKKSIDVAF